MLKAVVNLTVGKTRRTDFALDSQATELKYQCSKVRVQEAAQIGQKYWKASQLITAKRLDI